MNAFTRLGLNIPEKISIDVSCGGQTPSTTCFRGR